MAVCALTVALEEQAEQHLVGRLISLAALAEVEAAQGEAVLLAPEVLAVRAEIQEPKAIAVHTQQTLECRGVAEAEVAVILL
jgi:hypothetical protein